MAESGENPDMDPAEDADAPDSVQDDTDSSQDDAGSTEEQDPEAEPVKRKLARQAGKQRLFRNGRNPGRHR